MSFQRPTAANRSTAAILGHPLRALVRLPVSPRTRRSRSSPDRVVMAARDRGGGTHRRAYVELEMQSLGRVAFSVTA